MQATIADAHPEEDLAALIAAGLRPLPVPLLPELAIHTAHPGSRLGRITAAAGHEPLSPYWAYPWAGGIALARYLLDRPETVSGRRVLDLGAGSGLVGIAALRAGAASVLAVDIDPLATAAAVLNASANGVHIRAATEDLTGGASPPQIDVVVVGDLFYDPQPAERVTRFLDRCLAAGLEVLVGDPYRAHLPQARLALLAEYRVPDVGAVRGAAGTAAGAFRFIAG